MTDFKDWKISLKDASRIIENGQKKASLTNVLNNKNPIRDAWQNVVPSGDVDAIKMNIIQKRRGSQLGNDMVTATTKARYETVIRYYDIPWVSKKLAWNFVGWFAELEKIETARLTLTWPQRWLFDTLLKQKSMSLEKINTILPKLSLIEDTVLNSVKNIDIIAQKLSLATSPRADKASLEKYISEVDAGKNTVTAASNAARKSNVAKSTAILDTWSDVSKLSAEQKVLHGKISKQITVIENTSKMSTVAETQKIAKQEMQLLKTFATQIKDIQSATEIEKMSKMIDMCKASKWMRLSYLVRMIDSGMDIQKVYWEISKLYSWATFGDDLLKILSADVQWQKFVAEMKNLW
jgi:hypothetical protein